MTTHDVHAARRAAHERASLEYDEAVGAVRHLCDEMFDLVRRLRLSSERRDEARATLSRTEAALGQGGAP